MLLVYTEQFVTGKVGSLSSGSVAAIVTVIVVLIVVLVIVAVLCRKRRRIKVVIMTGCVIILSCYCLVLACNHKTKGHRKTI